VKRAAEAEALSEATIGGRRLDGGKAYAAPFLRSLKLTAAAGWSKQPPSSPTLAGYPDRKFTTICWNESEYFSRPFLQFFLRLRVFLLVNRCYLHGKFF
jgi:hypothetical protein